MINKNKFIFIILLITLFFISSCSFDYSQALDAENLADEIPITVFFNFTQTKVVDGNISRRINAEEAKTYSNNNKSELKSINFIEFDKEGNEITTGQADRAILYTDTDNAEIFGSIYFYSKNEETGIYAETLFWNNEERKLNSDPNKPDERVRIVKDDGSFVEGNGFEVNLRKKELIFTSSVNGQQNEKE